jgi:hypothetical protein
MANCALPRQISFRAASHARARRLNSVNPDLSWVERLENADSIHNASFGLRVAFPVLFIDQPREGGRLDQPFITSPRCLGFSGPRPAVDLIVVSALALRLTENQHLPFFPLSSLNRRKSVRPNQHVPGDGQGRMQAGASSVSPPQIRVVLVRSLLHLKS